MARPDRFGERELSRAIGLDARSEGVVSTIRQIDAQSLKFHMSAAFGHADLAP